MISLWGFPSAFACSNSSFACSSFWVALSTASFTSATNSSTSSFCFFNSSSFWANFSSAVGFAFCAPASLCVVSAAWVVSSLASAKMLGKFVTTAVPNTPAETIPAKINFFLPIYISLQLFFSLFALYITNFSKTMLRT